MSASRPSDIDNEVEWVVLRSAVWPDWIRARKNDTREGDVTKKLTVKANHFTKSAREKIEAKGGTCELIAPPKKPVRNKMGQGNRAKKKWPEGT